MSYCGKIIYRFFRPVVDEVVERYLRGGDLYEGFATVRCTNPDKTLRNKSKKCGKLNRIGTLIFR